VGVLNFLKSGRNHGNPLTRLEIRSILPLYFMHIQKGAKVDKTLSTADVAKRLQVHPTTVQGWVRKGYFPNAYKVGLGKNSPYIIPESDIIAFEEKRHNAIH
jgi:hypothetical protein